MWIVSTISDDNVPFAPIAYFFCTEYTKIVKYWLYTIHHRPYTIDHRLKYSHSTHYVRFSYHTAWYPNLCKKLKNKIQTTQNKCVRFCLNLDKMAHISQNEFKKLNWLPISDRTNQCILSATFKFVNDIGPNYLNGRFQWAAESNRTLQNNYLKLKHPLCKITAGQNSLSFLGPSKWNKLPESTKKCNNINTFKHNFKKLYLTQLAN